MKQLKMKRMHAKDDPVNTTAETTSQNAEGWEEGARFRENVHQSIDADRSKIDIPHSQDKSFQEHVRQEHEQPWITVSKRCHHRAGRKHPRETTDTVLPGCSPRRAKIRDKKK
jgi:hypothetical protein